MSYSHELIVKIVEQQSVEIRATETLEKSYPEVALNKIKRELTVAM